MAGVEFYDAGRILRTSPQENVLSSGDRRLYSIINENSNGTVLGSNVSNLDLIGIKLRLLCSIH
jgi:hypothetical protein